MLALLLSGCGSQGLSAPSLLWSVPLPSTVHLPYFVSAVLPLPHDVLAVSLSYPDLPGSGQVWWLNLRTGLWKSGPVAGTGTLIDTPAGLVLAGNLDGVATVEDIATGRQWWGGSAQSTEHIVAAALVEGSAVAVAVAHSNSGEILMVTPAGVMRRLQTQGMPTALATRAGQLWWATTHPDRLWALAGQTLRDWRLVGPLTQLAAGPDGIAGLIEQPRDAFGLSSLVAWSRRGRSLSYVGIAAAEDWSVGSRVLPQGPIGAVSVAPPRDGASWIMLYSPNQHQGWLASLDLATGALTPAMSRIPAAVPSTFLPDLPMAFTRAYVAAGMGAGLIIRENPGAGDSAPTP